MLTTYSAVRSHDPKAIFRVRRSVEATFEKHAADEAVTGFPTFAEAVGEKVARTAMKWLGITPALANLQAAASPKSSSESTGGSEPPNLLTQIHRDHGNAERLIAMHGQDLRYCHAFKKWLTWDGRRWCVDETDRARRFCKATMIEFYRQAVENHMDAAEKFARESLDSKRITNALREAQDGLVVTPDELDSHPFLLTFTNTMVDLRTGELVAHSREFLITKLVGFRYDPDAKAPTFGAFLARIMGHHPDASEGQLDRAQRLIDFIRRALGYSLTGATTEKAVFLPYGAGDNGKSTLLSLFLELLKEYAVLLQIDTLMVRQESNNTQADLADLRGARFVSTSETEEGQRLAEGKLKRITQGMGRIKATKKYENPIEFNETHKLWIDANHLPVVRGTDNAIWNRLHAIPFNVMIPKEEQDKQLRSKLLAEAEGILAWAVSGAIEWYQRGLGKPPEVERAGREWRSESDQIGRFLEECCVVGSFAEAKGRALFQAYRQWAEQAGERAQTETGFLRRLAEMGYSKRHTERGRVYEGLGLKAQS